MKKKRQKKAPAPPRLSWTSEARTLTSHMCRCCRRGEPIPLSPRLECADPLANKGTLLGGRTPGTRQSTQEEVAAEQDKPPWLPPFPQSTTTTPAIPQTTPQEGEWRSNIIAVQRGTRLSPEEGGRVRRGPIPRRAPSRRSTAPAGVAIAVALSAAKGFPQYPRSPTPTTLHNTKIRRGHRRSSWQGDKQDGKGGRFFHKCSYAGRGASHRDQDLPNPRRPRRRRRGHHAPRTPLAAKSTPSLPPGATALASKLPRTNLRRTTEKHRDQGRRQQLTTPSGRSVGEMNPRYPQSTYTQGQVHK